MKDISQQGKWPRARFEEFIRSLGHDYDRLLRQIKQVIGLAVLGAAPKMHAEASAQWGRLGGDSRRFYELVGLDVLIEQRPAEGELATLHPYVLEANFNPDSSLYHQEDIGPKGGAWRDVVRLAGLVPGTATPTAGMSDEQLKVFVGLAALPMCELDSPDWNNPENEKRTASTVRAEAPDMQRFDRVTSMRHKRKLIPIKPLGCVTRYDLNLIAEADAELDRAGGFERVIPSEDMNGYAMWSPDHRYADLVLQRVLVTNRTRTPPPPLPPLVQPGGGDDGEKPGKGKRGKKGKKARKKGAAKEL